ncbi:60S ribosomal protein L13-1 [Capsicum baccatum]|uniref:60S ribosomal protein L13-1 n=1 Tax=Capsicum baccatum TaxID=33114 RepID=A0A2G2XLS3_CAPBA|nr:60S ribosomal protein L13-1 [Capsicum baccatum]
MPPQVQGACLPVTREQPTVELVKVLDEIKSFNAYGKLRNENTNARHVGVRQKMVAEAEKEMNKSGISSCSL